MGANSFDGKSGGCLSMALTVPQNVPSRTGRALCETAE